MRNPVLKLQSKEVKNDRHTPEKKPAALSNNTITTAWPNTPDKPSVPVVSSPLQHTLDHRLHAAVAKLTGNLSPASLGLARHDWLVHLAFSPDKIVSLHKSLFEKAAQLSWYAMKGCFVLNFLYGAPTR